MLYQACEDEAYICLIVRAIYFLVQILVAPAQVRGRQLVCKLSLGGGVWGEVCPPQARKFWRYLVSITAFWP